MELLRYLRLLRRRWMLVAASVLLALTAAALATARMSPEYSSSITMIVSAPDEGTAGGTAAYQGVLSSQERAKSYAELIRSRRVTEAVAAAVGGGVTADDLRRRITARALPDTMLLRATVTDESPALAMRIGHALGTEFPRYVDRLERPASPARPAARVVVADDADLPAAPVSPRPSLNLALGLVIGLLAGLAAAVLRDCADTSLRSVRSLRQAAGGAALGVVSHDRSLGERVVAAPGSRRAEEFRLIGAGLRLRGDAPPRSVVVTGSAAQEGRSLVACNLAVALAESGSRVILVDAATSGSGLAAHLGIDEGQLGLTSVLAGDRPVEEALRQWGPESLYVLAGGPPPFGGLLASPKMASVIGELERRADIVVVDAPPVLTCAGTAVLARRCTGVVIVARYGRTRREEVTRTVERLETVQAQVLGSVLGFVPDEGRDAVALPWSLEPLGRRVLAARR
jgi:capsular exopolysaccharide synthesis family protein